MNFLQQALAYIFTAGNGAATRGLGARILEHLQYTAVAVAVSALIAIPVGLIIGPPVAAPCLWSLPSTGCGRCPRSGCCCSGYCCGDWVSAAPRRPDAAGGSTSAGRHLSGIANVDPTVVDAARSMGMTESGCCFGSRHPMRCR